jgi:thiol-disulfide isomerase/thioredoxin
VHATTTSSSFAKKKQQRRAKETNSSETHFQFKMINSIKFLAYVLSIASVSLRSDDKGNTGVLVFRSVSASSAAETTTTSETTASDDDGAIELTPTAFRAQLQAKPSNEKYFAKFYAPWCGHCKSMAKDWDALAAEMKSEGRSDLKLFSVDASTQAEASVAREFEIKSFPTLMYFEDGKMFPYSGGARTKEALGNYLVSENKKDARKFSFKGESFKLQQPGVFVRAKKFWEESLQVIAQVYKHKAGAVYVLYGAGLVTGISFASLFFVVVQRTGSDGKKSKAAAKGKGSAKKTN